MLKCDKCVREFETPKSLSSHKAWHTRQDYKRTSLLIGPWPKPVSRVTIDLDSEGNLKIDIKKENKVLEEFGIE